MLIVPDASRAKPWYERALGAEVLWDLDSVVGMQITGAPFFLHEANPDNPAERSPTDAGVTTTRVELFVDDPEVALERALRAGATLRSAIAERGTPRGIHRQGGFRDPFGHVWSVGDKTPTVPQPAGTG